MPVWIYNENDSLLGHIDFKLDSKIPECIFIPNSRTPKNEDEALMLELFNLGYFIYRKTEEGHIQLSNASYSNVTVNSSVGGLEVGSKKYPVKVSSHCHTLIEGLFGNTNDVTINWPANT